MNCTHHHMLCIIRRHLTQNPKRIGARIRKYVIDDIRFKYQGLLCSESKVCDRICHLGPPKFDKKNCLPLPFVKVVILLCQVAPESPNLNLGTFRGSTGHFWAVFFASHTFVSLLRRRWESIKNVKKVLFWRQKKNTSKTRGFKI